MGQPVVHFEIIGTDPATLRDYYGGLFGWEYSTGDATTESVSQPGRYHFVAGRTLTGDADDAGDAGDAGEPGDPGDPDGRGDAGAAGAPGPINGGIGGGEGHTPRVLFYVAVPDVGLALHRAEALGGRRVMGPEPASGDFTVGHLADPEGNVVGVAGPTAGA